MEEFFTVNQAAISLKVHPLTVRRYINEGKLKAYRVGGNVRISVNDLRAFTLNFMPQPKQPKSNLAPQTNAFSFSDPLLNLKGKGLSVNKVEE